MFLVERPYGDVIKQWNMELNSAKKVCLSSLHRDWPIFIMRLSSLINLFCVNRYALQLLHLFVPITRTLQRFIKHKKKDFLFVTWIFLSCFSVLFPTVLNKKPPLTQNVRSRRRTGIIVTSYIYEELNMLYHLQLNCKASVLCM